MKQVSILMVLGLLGCASSSLPHPEIRTTRAEGEPATGRKVIKRGELEVLTSHLEDGFDKASRMARQMGGYTVSSTRGDSRIGLTLRVPGPRFEEALRRLSNLGKVDRRRITGEDVTTRHMDLSVRLANAERMRERYLELLKQAANVAEAVKVQKELERVTETIETLKGKLKLMDNQVALATIDLALEKPVRPGPVGWVFYGLYKGVAWLFVWE